VTDDAIRLTVFGEPHGKDRPRFDPRTGRTYTPTATVRAEQHIIAAWLEAGRPVLDGPLRLSIEVALQRPQGHWLRDGSLSAAGSRTPWPTRRPDVDNLIKLIADALNGRAYRDDALIVEARIVRRWCNPGELEHTSIVITPMPMPGLALQDAA
jgi:Holliday junction resolvase RusA-like endonuclease